MWTVLTAVFSLSTGLEALNSRRALRKCLSKLKDASAGSLTIHGETDAIRQRQADFLKEKCRQLAETLASKAQAQREQLTDASTELDRELTEALASPEQLILLYGYIAHQWILAENRQRPEYNRPINQIHHPNQIPDHHITELRFRVKLYTLMQTTLKTGALMELLTPSDQAAFAQTLNKAFLPTLSEVETTVRDRLERLLPLIERELKAERLLQHASLAAEPFRSSTHEPPEELGRLNLMTQQLANIRKQAQDALSQIDLEAQDALTPAEQLLTATHLSHLAVTNTTLQEFLDDCAADTLLNRLLAEQIEEQAIHPPAEDSQYREAQG
jgi:hypothetical protein